MFDLVTKHKRIAQVVFALVALPFAFFGVDYYFRGAGGPQSLATIGGDRITQEEYDRRLREQQDRMREQLGRNYDPSMFDSPEVRYALLDQLVNERLLERRARSDNLRVSDAQLAQFIQDLPPFQDNGKFSKEKYTQLLASRNMTPLGFEQRVRQDLTLAPLQEPVAAANINAKSSVERFLALVEQQRDVAVAAIDPAPFAKDVKVDDAQVKAFYEQTPMAFQSPEEAKIEYVILTQEALIGQVKVDPEDVRRQYESNISQYSTKEQRRASHILIAVKPDAKDAEKAEAKKKAEALLAQVKANPAKFADLAKANSQDPGSAQQGGDLGTFARGSMVKPFEDAVFAAKLGDIVGPVQSDFGYHVIKVTGITPERIQPLEEVRAQIDADMKRQKASQKFAASAEQFQNLVYEQADSLAPAAKQLDLKVETTPLITRAQAQQIALGNAKFVEALFSPESVHGKRNTDAMEIAPNVLMAARVIEYKPAALRPLADVQDQIRQQLVRKAASEAAQQAGRDKLKLLQDGKSDKEAGVTFTKTLLVNRNAIQPGFSPDALKSIFQLSSAKLPAYTGAPNERGGFSIYKVEKVVDPPLPDAAKLNTAGSRMAEQVGRELMTAYLASLRAGTDVKINQAGLEKK
ncbi:MAG TPA: SurA N-terminal domain-containing protein [Casimicrobiaceae bacterium]|jgi:peptidyl-prolyl cis-trans isomerase D|nr:SurA N-terminal domain-containing protein [Casimicrobiaceae bacterium]